MKREALNGLAMNVSAIIVLHAANRFSEARNAAGHAKKTWQMNWTGRFDNGSF
jgi:hypothetical protein